MIRPKSLIAYMVTVLLAIPLAVNVHGLGNKITEI